MTQEGTLTSFNSLGKEIITNAGLQEIELEWITSE